MYLPQGHRNWVNCGHNSCLRPFPWKNIVYSYMYILYREREGRAVGVGDTYKLQLHVGQIAVNFAINHCTLYILIYLN